MRVDLIQIGYESSLALRNLIHYARLDPDIASVADYMKKKGLEKAVS